MKYKNLFFDLDDTLWAFSANARDTFEEMYYKYKLDAFFDSFEHFYSLYQRRNIELWMEYGNGQITKEELNRQRFLYPLAAVGAGDFALAKAYSDYFFKIRFNSPGTHFTVLKLPKAIGQNIKIITRSQIIKYLLRMRHQPSFSWDNSKKVIRICFR